MFIVTPHTLTKVTTGSVTKYYSLQLGNNLGTLGTTKFTASYVMFTTDAS